MTGIAHPNRNLSKPLHLFILLLLIISLAGILIIFLLPFVLSSGASEWFRNLAGALLLSSLIGPSLWWLIVRPLRIAAMSEFSRTEAVLAHMADAVINFDGQGNVKSLNPSAEGMFGYLPNEIIGQSISCILPEMGEGLSVTSFNANSIGTGGGWHNFETVGCHKNQTCFPLDLSISKIDLEGRLTFIAIIHNIAERKRYEERLEFQANHDGLTNLPNRNLLNDRIRQAMLMSQRSHSEIAVFFVDIDNFKFINDSLGHDIGDMLLKIAAERLTGCVRSGDTVARQGGDEFVIVISDQSVSDHATLIADKMQELIAQPFCINEHELVITCSIGISIFPRDGEDVQTLIKNAEAAMYRAKEQGRNTFQFFTGEMNARSLARMTMEKYLRRALEHDELLVYYQPKVSLVSGRITSMEALVRWQHPEMGLVSPVNFIPLAEETGLIEPIGEWVLRTACKQNKAWQNAGFAPLTVAVNLSVRQFRQQDIVGLIGKLLLETGIDPRYLELEITESIVMQDVDRVTTILKDLKGLGTSLAMDDFGTGYSSLGYLTRFPFDKLKIDQSFVRHITSDPENAAIAKTVIAMAHSLHLKVIAEGVETEGQLNYLRSHGCDEIQGYYFSRPVPALEFEQLLREDRHLQLAPINRPSLEKTILVVDDEKEVATALQRMLVLEEYQVLIAGSAAEGFELLANNQVSVIISDQRMPVMTGTEFLSRVKELYPDTVRIILTAHADLNSVTDAINRGAIYKFLNKPWSDDDIRKTIDEAFKLRASLTLRRSNVPWS